MTCAGLKGRCFLKLKSVLLEVGYIEKWPKFAYLELKVPHLKFRVMRDRVYTYFVFCTEVNDLSKPDEKICLWAWMITIIVSVAIFQLPIC